MSNTRVKRKKRKTRFWRVLVLVLLFCTLGGGSYFAYNFYTHAKGAGDKIYQEIDRDRIPNHREEEVEVAKEPFTILLAGIEDQEGGERSDVLMLATVNPSTEEVLLLSIPRDTRTYVSDLGYKTKINHAYGVGGIESTIETVTGLIDVPIDYYITTNFDGFEDIVNTLGGITIDVPFTFKSQLTDSLKWKTFNEGEMNLNGNEALAYVRMRKSDPEGDHGRNKRQQQVIKAIVDKGTSFSTISKIDNILDDLGENVKTNIPPYKLSSFLNLYTKIKNASIQNLTIDGYDEYINDIYYYIPQEQSLTDVTAVINNTLNNETLSSKNAYSSDSQ